jgi:predicted esterase
MFQPPTAHFSTPIGPPLSVPVVVSEKKIRTFEERHLSVTRTARYALLGSTDNVLSEVWFVCHGHGQLAKRFLARFLPLEREDRLFVAPEALSRYYLSPPRGGPHPPDAPVGASWMTYEDREAEIEDYVGYLDALHNHIFSLVERSTVRLWVLGFSQGVATVARWVARGNVQPDKVVFYAGILPSEMDASSAARLAQKSPLTVVLGTRDEFARPDLVAQQEARLRKLNVPSELIRFDGGHEIMPDVLMRLAGGDAR